MAEEEKKEHSKADKEAEENKPEDEQSEWYKQGVAKEQPNFFIRHKKATVGVIFLMALGFGGNYYISKSTERAPINTSSILDTLGSEETAVNTDGPVATVNGEEIPRLAYINKLNEINSVLARQGFNTGNAKIASEIRQQAIAELVNMELLYQTATADGYDATQTEISELYQLLLEDAGSEEILLLMLQDRSLTTDDLYQAIEEQIVVDKYIEANVDFSSATVSAEQVESYYEMVSATNPDLPPFIDVEERLTAELEQQASQELVTELIQRLRQEAEIEVLI